MKKNKAGEGRRNVVGRKRRGCNVRYGSQDRSH
jgi:hypothetical protein